MKNDEFESLLDEKIEEKGDSYATMGGVDPKEDRAMSDARSEAMTLTALHDMPWRTVEGAYVHVEIEEDTRDPLDPSQDDVDEPYEYEEREGTIVGRGAGTALTYDRELGELVSTSIGPMVVLDTPEDTYLEVRTDKPGNELLAVDLE